MEQISFNLMIINYLQILYHILYIVFYIYFDNSFNNKETLT